MLSFPQLLEDDGSLTSILKSSRLWYLPSIICAGGWMGGRSMRNVEGQAAWFTQDGARESLGKYLGRDQTDVMWYVLNTDLYIRAFYCYLLANHALSVQLFHFKKELQVKESITLCFWSGAVMFNRACSAGVFCFFNKVHYPKCPYLTLSTWIIEMNTKQISNTVLHCTKWTHLFLYVKCNMS